MNNQYDHTKKTIPEAIGVTDDEIEEVTEYVTDLIFGESDEEKIQFDFSTTLEKIEAKAKIDPTYLRIFLMAMLDSVVSDMVEVGCVGEIPELAELN